MKYILNMAASAAVLSFASVASSASAANTYYVDNVTLNPYQSLIVNGQSQLAGAIGLDLTNAMGGFTGKTLWVFCVDLYHDIGLGSYAPPLAYTVSPVTYDSHGGASGSGGSMLLQPVLGEIDYLVALGDAIAYGPNAFMPAQQNALTDIQGAIWTVEYPSVTVAGNSMAQNTAIHNLVMDAANSGDMSDPSGFYPEGGGSQGFGFTQGFAFGPIPEPASWAMMIVGVGGLGAVARIRRRSAMATPTA